MPIRVPKKQENKEPVECTSEVRANNPPKVKSMIKEFPITQVVSVRKFHVPQGRGNLVLI